jgi:60 kDa SS-A/Ro ribonucleoprotein
MSINYGKLFSRKQTPQSQPIPGSMQVANSAGGFAWPVDDWMRLERFLVLGCEGGSYYAAERTLTRENAEAVARCLLADGKRVVERTVAVSDAGRAPKNDPAIFALAMAAKLGDFETRRAALAALPKVCRIGTHLLHFADYLQSFGGWGRGTRSAVQRWFNDQSPRDLAYQVAKYQSRDGWSTRDLLRLAHPKAPTAEHDALYRWVVRGELGEVVPEPLRLLEAVERAKRATDARQVVQLIDEHNLPRECVPTEWLNDQRVWAALLERMPMTAMIRNLATMTRVGLLQPLSAATRTVVERLRDAKRLGQARIHPIAVLAALNTYAAGRGFRGQHTWTPVTAITSALDGAFYATFKQVEPSGARMLLALDVSSSMDGGVVAGVPGLTPRMASAAMALVTAATEEQHAFVAFTTSLSELDISPGWRLDRVVERMRGLPFGGTDCAQPMLWALERGIEVDTFVVYTDSETWAGSSHPAQALREYRQRAGIPAKLIVVGMVANGFSIADPDDGGMLDVVGFDTATPTVIGDFAKPQQ